MSDHPLANTAFVGSPDLGTEPRREVRLCLIVRLGKTSESSLPVRDGYG